MLQLAGSTSSVLGLLVLSARAQARWHCALEEQPGCGRRGAARLCRLLLHGRRQAAVARRRAWRSRSSGCRAWAARRCGQPRAWRARATRCERRPASSTTATRPRSSARRRRVTAPRRRCWWRRARSGSRCRAPRSRRPSSSAPGGATPRGRSRRAAWRSRARSIRSWPSCRTIARCSHPLRRVDGGDGGDGGGGDDASARDPRLGNCGCGATASGGAAAGGRARACVALRERVG